MGSLKKTRYTYRSAVEGTAPDPPEPLIEGVSHIAGVDDLIDGAFKRIVNLNGHDENAMEYVENRVDHERDQHDILRIAMYLARKDTRYWGVEDPDKEKYCTDCRNVHPIEEFEEGAYKCRYCNSKRGR